MFGGVFLDCFVVVGLGVLGSFCCVFSCFCFGVFLRFVFFCVEGGCVLYGWRGAGHLKFNHAVHGTYFSYLPSV